MTDEGHKVMRVVRAGTSLNNLLSVNARSHSRRPQFFLITYIINGPASTKNRKQTALTGLIQYRTSVRLI